MVVGEARTSDDEPELMRSRDVEVVLLNDQRCVDTIRMFPSDKPELWAEDNPSSAGPVLLTGD